MYCIHKNEDKILHIFSNHRLILWNFKFKKKKIAIQTKFPLHQHFCICSRLTNLPSIIPLNVDTVWRKLQVLNYNKQNLLIYLEKHEQTISYNWSWNEIKPWHFLTFSAIFTKLSPLVFKGIPSLFSGNYFMPSSLWVFFFL